MSVPEEVLNNPQISVIIPAYNAREFIVDTINSVLMQTFPVHEIIVVDDGSIDGTAEFVRQYYGNKVKIVRQENKGQSGARNTGIKIATGNIFQFLDADDLLLPNKLERQLDFWRRNPNFDIVYCDYLNFQHGNPPSIIPPSRPRLQGNLLESLVLGETFPPHAPLVPRKVVEIVGYFREDIRISPDQWFWVTCSIQGFTFGYLPEILVLRRLHNTNLTKDRIAQLKAAVDFHRWTLSLNLPLHLVKNIHRNLANEYAELAIEFARKRILTESWKYLWKAQQHRFIAAKIGSRRDKALWLVDILLWLNGVREGILGVVKIGKRGR